MKLLFFLFLSAQSLKPHAFSDFRIIPIRDGGIGSSSRRRTLTVPLSLMNDDDNNIEWTSDFDDFLQSDDDDSSSSSSDSLKISSIFKSRSARDLSGTQTRQFSLGPDIILSDFVGKMGFDEVTDWEYYYRKF